MTSSKRTGTPTKGGEEVDAFSRYRRLLSSFKRPGAAKSAKQSFNRRVRRNKIEPDEYTPTTEEPEQ